MEWTVGEASGRDGYEWFSIYKANGLMEARMDEMVSMEWV